MAKGQHPLLTADELKDYRLQTQGYEDGEEYTHPASPLIRVQGLEDTYRLNRWSMCYPVSGDATQLRFGFLY